jgi:hypothetical protein
MTVTRYPDQLAGIPGTASRLCFFNTLGRFWDDVLRLPSRRQSYQREGDRLWSCSKTMCNRKGIPWTATLAWMS